MLHNINKNVSLCLIVWNERRGCEIDIPLLPCESFYEVYAVDGGSTDGTVNYLESNNIPVYQQPIKSLNAAYHHAVNLCKSETLVVFFPKGSIDPKIVLRLAESVCHGIKLVIASRNIPGGSNEEDNNWFKPRKWGVMVLALFSAFIWRREGPWIRDVLHGVKAFSVEAFNKMEVSKIGVSIDLEMVVRAYKLKLSRKEIPVIENCRLADETHFKIIPTAKRLTFFLFKELMRFKT